MRGSPAPTVADGSRVAGGGARGSYYTLDEIAQFDRKGLWSLRSVWFSKYGTLLATVKALVAACEAGYYVDELEDVVQVDVKAPLLKLVREKRLAREQVFGRYLYLATDVSTRKQQLSARQAHEASPSTLGWVGGVRVLPVELKAAIVLFYSLLDEKQRRLTFFARSTAIVVSFIRTPPFSMRSFD